MEQPSATGFVTDYVLDEVTEELVFLIRQSCYIQLARVGAYLDGAVLAAEQVQDTRIQDIATPKEITGLEFWGNVMAVLLLESNLFGRLLTLATRRLIFTPLLRTHLAFRALPKSDTGKQLLARVQKRLTTLQRRQQTGTAAPAATFKAALQSVKGGRQLLTPGNIKLYHGSIKYLVEKSDPGAGLQTLGQVAKEIANRDKPRAAPTVGADDSAGVKVLAAAQSHVSFTRLGIQVTHARFEQEIRARHYTPGDVGDLIEVFGWEDLALENGRISVELDDLRTLYKMVFEAVIWARLYGFDQKQKSPKMYRNRAEYEGVPTSISNYWFARFGNAVDEWNESRQRFPGSFANQPASNKARYLQEYFWDISTAVAKISQSQLRQPVTTR